MVFCNRVTIRCSLGVAGKGSREGIAERVGGAGGVRVSEVE